VKDLDTGGSSKRDSVAFAKYKNQMQNFKYEQSNAPDYEESESDDDESLSDYKQPEPTAQRTHQQNFAEVKKMICVLIL
jgi:hypothetical protein